VEGKRNEEGVQWDERGVKDKIKRRERGGEKKIERGGNYEGKGRKKKRGRLEKWERGGKRSDRGVKVGGKRSERGVKEGRKRRD
jgi:hypothetical protein